MYSRIGPTDEPLAVTHPAVRNWHPEVDVALDSRDRGRLAATRAAPPPTGAAAVWNKVGGSLGYALRTGRLLVAVTGGPDTTAPVTVAHALEQRNVTAV